MVPPYLDRPGGRPEVRHLDRAEGLEVLDDPGGLFRRMTYWSTAAALPMPVQVAEWAAEAFATHFPGLPPERLEALVNERMERQARLSLKPTEVVAIIDEGTVRRAAHARSGAAQLSHLEVLLRKEAAGVSDVIVRIVPFTAGYFAVAGLPLIAIETFGGGRWFYLEQWHGGADLVERDEWLTTGLADLQEIMLGREASVDLISQVLAG